MLYSKLFTVPYNTGFLVAYGVKHALDIINSVKSV